MQGQRQLSKRVCREDIEGLEKIGEGKCADIYTNGNTVYKILKENSDSRDFYSKEMLQHLVGIKSDLCVFPNEILEDNNGNLLGYSMNFVPGKKMKDVIGMLSFKQIQATIENAKHSIKAISEQGILFDDLHDDNVMWNEETQNIQIIDTDFFKKADNISDLNDINYQKFSNTIRYMINVRVYQYGRTVNEELIPFYDTTRLSSTKDEKPLPINEYILNLKSVIEKDFGRQFDNLNEMEIALQEKQFETEEQEYLEKVANNLTIKERFIRFLAQSKYIRKIPFVNKLINNKIKMLPQDVQKVVNKTIDNDNLTESEQIEERNEANQARKKFIQGLTNWTTTEQEYQNNITDKIEDKIKNRNESDDLTL